MSDEADRAQLMEIRERDVAIASVRAAADPPGFRWVGDCITCLDPIEEERAAASPGCKRCLACQTAYEKFQRLFPRGAR